MTRFFALLLALLTAPVFAESPAEILDPGTDKPGIESKHEPRRADVPASGAVDEPGFKASVKFANQPAPNFDLSSKNTNQIAVPKRNNWAVPQEDGVAPGTASHNPADAAAAADDKAQSVEDISPALAAVIAREKAGGKLRELIPVYQAIALAEKDNAAPHFRLGMALIRSNDMQSGLKELELAIVLQPKNGKYLCDYGIAALKAGWVEKAFAACQAAVSGAPTNARYLSALGDVHLAAAHLPEAADAYTRAIKAEPQNSSYYYNLGLTYMHARDFKRAAELFNEAIKMKPGFAPYYCSRGLAAENLRNQKQAIEDYQTAFKLDKTNAYAHFLYAGVFSDPDDPTYTNRFEAVEHAEKAVKLTQYKNAQYLMGLARALRVGRNYEQAVEAARKAVELEPTREDYRKELAQYEQYKKQGIDR
jgi:tetratricopeptide (TPR) repeat protein